MNVTDDRQTDHTTKKCAAIDRIACTEMIPPNKTTIKKQTKILINAMHNGRFRTGKTKVYRNI